MLKAFWITSIVAAILLTLTIVFGFLFLDSIIFLSLPRKIVVDWGIPERVARGIAALAAVPLALVIRSLFSIHGSTRQRASFTLWGLVGFYLLGVHFYTSGFYYSAMGNPRKCYAKTIEGIVFFDAPCMDEKGTPLHEPKYNFSLQPVGEAGPCGNHVIVAYEWAKGLRSNKQSGMPIRFCERSNSGRVITYESPFHPINGEILRPCCGNDLISVEEQSLQELRNSISKMRQDALNSKAHNLAKAIWDEAEESRREAEKAYRDKDYLKARTLFERTRQKYEEAKKAVPAVPSPTPTPSDGSLTLYQGAINNEYQLEMRLKIEGPTIKGSYFYLSSKTPLVLEGKIDDTNNVTINGYDGDGKIIDVFTGVMQESGEFSGNYIRQRDGAVMPFMLKK